MDKEELDRLSPGQKVVIAFPRFNTRKKTFERTGTIIYVSPKNIIISEEESGLELKFSRRSGQSKNPKGKIISIL